MTKLSEINAALFLSRQNHGRPDAAVLRWNPKWVENPALYKGDDLVAGWWGDGVTLNLGGPLATMKVRAGPAKWAENGVDMIAWGLTRIGPGVWDVSPSLHRPNAFHVYVVLSGVPEPAPWESR